MAWKSTVKRSLVESRVFNVNLQCSLTFDFHCIYYENIAMYPFHHIRHFAFCPRRFLNITIQWKKKLRFNGYGVSCIFSIRFHVISSIRVRRQFIRLKGEIQRLGSTIYKFVTLCRCCHTMTRSNPNTILKWSI